jgi:hypothetical protein
LEAERNRRQVPPETGLRLDQAPPRLLGSVDRVATRNTSDRAFHLSAEYTNVDRRHRNDRIPKGPAPASHGHRHFSEHVPGWS